MHTKKKKALTHTLVRHLHTHSENSTSAQLNSFPDVHVVDRGEWGVATSYFERTQTQNRPLSGTHLNMVDESET